MRIRQIAAVAGAVLLTVAAAVPDNTPQAAYIRKYALVAVKEMYRSGVPASITLAQGILESRSGQSSLAVDGNNHFGIKCHDWTGKKMYYDDDQKGECFRVYGSAEESFRDHSDFLRYRDRYKSLFDNDITDYKAWAKGLKKAGYATDPAYPSKLIRIIEDYKLYDYDRMSPKDLGDSSEDNGLSRKEKKAARRAARKAAKSAGTAAADAGNPTAVASGSVGTSADVVATDMVPVPVPETGKDGESVMDEQLPASPHELEEPKRILSGEQFTYSLKRQAYTKNGVPFVYSVEGETYGSIASEYNLFLREILRFNDAPKDMRLAPGTTVYLQSKKSQTARGLDKYISDEGGESLRDISQRFAVRMKDLCKMNGLGSDYVTQPGDELYLRGGKRN